jgi:HlyD family secretion protein
MKKILRLVLLFAILFVFGYTVYYLWSKEEVSPIVYTTEQAYTATIIKKTVATGSVVPRREIDIKPQVSGIIKEIYVIAGDQVKVGDLIAKVKIIPDMVTLNSAESRVDRAEITLEEAKLNYDRNLSLREQEVISESEFQPFMIGLKSAREELNTAENNLQLIREGASKRSSTSTNTLIRSTIDGMVLDVPVKEGNSVIESNTFNEGTTIATIADMNNMIFEGNVDESEVDKISQGMDLILNIGAIENLTFEAELEYISPKGVEESGAIQFEIRAALNMADSSKFIRAGYSANADIVLDRRDSVLSISEGLLQFIGDTIYVEVQVGAQQFERRDVTTGLSDGINIEVLSGITADDKIKQPNVNLGGPAFSHGDQ